MVFRQKTEQLSRRVKGLPQALPEPEAVGNRAINKLSEGVFEGRHARGECMPRSVQALLLYGTGWRVQTLGLDPRPLVKIPLQPLGPNGAVRQSMRRQH